MRKSKELLLHELGLLDTDKLSVCGDLKSWWEQCHATHDWSSPNSMEAFNSEVIGRREVYMSMLAKVNEFRGALCGVLGITHQPVSDHDSADLLSYIYTTEPILGGDVGVSTKINYGYVRPTEWENPHWHPYRVHMVSNNINIEVQTANTTKDLLTIISRGYTCLRIMANGTRYYHN